MTEKPGRERHWLTTYHYHLSHFSFTIFRVENPWGPSGNNQLFGIEALSPKLALPILLSDYLSLLELIKLYYSLLQKDFFFMLKSTFLSCALVFKINVSFLFNRCHRSVLPAAIRLKNCDFSTTTLNKGVIKHWFIFNVMQINCKYFSSAYWHKLNKYIFLKIFYLSIHIIFFFFSLHGICCCNLQLNVGLRYYIYI